MVLSIHRGIAFGSPSNAKPLLLLAIIKGIEDGNIIGNKIVFDEKIDNDYKMLCSSLEPRKKAAPMFKPFYHSVREGYYNLKWKERRLPTHKYHTPSAKFLRENLDFAFLEDGFWDILQDGDARNAFRELIISEYFNATTSPTI